MAKDGISTVDEIARAIALGYKVVRHLDGTVEFEANEKEDHGFAMGTVDRIGILAKEPYQEFTQATKTALPLTQSLNIPSIAIGKAMTLCWRPLENPRRRGSVSTHFGSLLFKGYRRWVCPPKCERRMSGMSWMMNIMLPTAEHRP